MRIVLKSVVVVAISLLATVGAMYLLAGPVLGPAILEVLKPVSYSVADYTNYHWVNRAVLAIAYPRDWSQYSQAELVEFLSIGRSVVFLIGLYALVMITAAFAAGFLTLTRMQKVLGLE